MTRQRAGVPDRCIIVMPVYNEQECIREACEEWLSALRELEPSRLLVVDDGSSDATPRILAEVAARHPAVEILRQPHLGHGPALRRGYAKALEMGCEWIFQVDSDRQFEPGDFLRVWSLRGEFDVVLGWRAQRRDHPVRRALSAGHRALVWLLFGTRLEDPNVPFRLLGAATLARLMSALPEGLFAPNTFLAIFARLAGERLCEVPVHHRPRRTGAGSLRAPRIVGVVVRCLIEMIGMRLRGVPRLVRPIDRPRPGPGRQTETSGGLNGEHAG